MPWESGGTHKHTRARRHRARPPPPASRRVGRAFDCAPAPRSPWRARARARDQVGDYYKGGFAPVSALVMGDYDRAAPLGVGAVKVAGNYAADLLPNSLGKAEGYPIALYLDAAQRKYVEEFSTSNFVGITGDGAFVTPDSPAVLPSITNKSLMQLAEEAGLRVERRPIEYAEVEAGAFSEVAAVGTAVVITPIGSIVSGDAERRVTTIGDGGVGKTMQGLYDRIRAIQTGDAPDEYGWTLEV